MIIPALPAATFVPCRRKGYSPVSKPYLDGVLVEAQAWTSVNLTPLLASASTLGVTTRVAP